MKIVKSTNYRSVYAAPSRLKEYTDHMDTILWADVCVQDIFSDGCIVILNDDNVSNRWHVGDMHDEKLSPCKVPDEYKVVGLTGIVFRELITENTYFLPLF